MKRITILVLLIGSLWGSGFGQSAKFVSNYAGNEYTSDITPERLSDAPAWLEDEANPPLSARRAREVAAVYLSRLFRDSGEWQLGQIALVPIRDRWVYTIQFAPPQKGCADCLFSPFTVVVLMDGSAVSATVSQVWVIR